MTRILLGAVCGLALWCGGCSERVGVVNGGAQNAAGLPIQGSPNAAETPAAGEVDGQAEANNVAAPLLNLDGKFVDLTHPFDEQTIYWPTAEGFRLQEVAAGVTEKGYYYAANRFTAAEHGGTHLDAPIHFAEGKETADEVPLARLIGPAVLVDVSAKCAENRDYEITVDDLRDWEEQHGRTLAETIVLLRTGYSAHWPDREKYLGTAETGETAVAKLHFPGLHPDAARWLAEHRAIRAIGIDTASIDQGQSTLFASHVTLFKNNIPAFENVAHLDALPAEGFAVIALPMKIGGGSGGPLRIVAVLPAGDDAEQAP